MFTSRPKTFSLSLKGYVDERGIHARAVGLGDAVIIAHGMRRPGRYWLSPDEYEYVEALEEVAREAQEMVNTDSLWARENLAEALAKLPPLPEKAIEGTTACK